MGSSDALASLVWAEVAASGCRQAEVCRAVGISQKHLSEMVNGRAGMSLDLVDRVLAAVGRELVLSTRVQVDSPRVGP
jgi:plasmid maintenance system antidote protein VapI